VQWALETPSAKIRPHRRWQPIDKGFGNYLECSSRKVGNTSSQTNTWSGETCFELGGQLQARVNDQS